MFVQWRYASSMLNKKNSLQRRNSTFITFKKALRIAMPNQLLNI